MSYKSETVWNKARVSREDFLTVANLVVLKHGQTLQERMLEAAKVENDFDRLKNSGLKSAPVDTFFPETIRAAVAVDDQPKVPNGFEENDDDSDSDSEPMSLAYTGGTAHVAGSATSARSTGLRSELAMEHCQREFLDRFAQLASNQKGGNSVVCSAMSRTNGKIIIWLTKNSKFTARELIKLEQKFPERLRLFAEVAQTEGNVGIASSQKRLWEEVVELAQKRIRETYGPQYLERMIIFLTEGSDGLHSSSDPKVMEKLARLRRVCESFSSSSMRVGEASILAYELRKDESIKRCLCNDSTSKGKGHRVWQSICFLGRARAAFTRFCQIAADDASFRSLTVRCLRHLSPDRQQSSSTTSLSDACKMFRDERSSIASSKADQEVKRRFLSLQKIELFVHAEVQMIWYLLDDENVWPYIGGSRYCCILCKLTLLTLGFDARNCHNKLYTGWTMPQGISILECGFERIAESLQHCHSQLLQMLVTDKRAAYLDAMPESSAAMTAAELQKSVTRMSPRQWQTQMAQEQTEQNRRDTAAFEERFGSLEGGSGHCVTCANFTERMCSTCGDAWMCSNECQKSYTDRHPSQCLDRITRWVIYRQCTVCGKARSRVCRACCSAAYCSLECWRGDKRVHETLCQQYSAVRYARPSITEDWRISLLFPVNQTLPSVTRVRVKKIRDEEDGVLWEKIDISDLLGDDDSVTGRVAVRHHVRRGTSLPCKVNIFHRDAYLKDGSPANQCVRSFVGESSHDWRGPLVIMRQPGIDHDPLPYHHAEMSDLTAACDYFGTYMEDYSEDPINAHERRPGAAVECVRINNTREMSLHGQPHFEQRLKPPGEFAAMDSWRSAIAYRVGVPLVIGELAHERGDVDPSPKRPLNIAASNLSYNIDMNSPNWGWHNLAVHLPLVATTAYLAWREDMKPLQAKTVEDVSHFCESLEPMFEDALGRGWVQRSKKEVMAMITSREFELFQCKRSQEQEQESAAS